MFAGSLTAVLVARVLQSESRMPQGTVVASIEMWPDGLVRNPKIKKGHGLDRFPTEVAGPGHPGRASALLRRVVNGRPAGQQFLRTIPILV